LTTKVFVLGAVASLVVGASIAAFSSSSEPSSAATAATSASTASISLGSTCTSKKSATGKPVVIGTVVELISPDAGIAGDDAAIKAINHCGGINGHPIKFDVCTDNGSTTAAVGCARNSVADPSTLAIGGQATSYGSQVDPIYAAGNLAVLGLAGPGTDLTSPNYFTPGISLAVTYADGLFAVKELHLDKIGVPYLNLGSFGTEVAAGFTAVVTGPNHVANAIAVPIDVPEPNFPAKAAALSGANVQVPALDDTRIIPLVQALSQAGENQPIVLNTSVFTSADYKKLSNLNPAPVVYDLSAFNLSSPGYKQYEANMKAIGQAGTTADNGVAINSWITIHEIADVANKIGPKVTRQSLLTALGGLTSYTTMGLTPPLNYTLRNPKLPLGNIINSTVVYYRVNSKGYTPIAKNAFESLLPSALVPS
jgi:ABC-type branched-subunit amino acid transport system substrate-binding protein